MFIRPRPSIWTPLKNAVSSLPRAARSNRSVSVTIERVPFNNRGSTVETGSDLGVGSVLPVMLR
jgi:hypothetical protein